MTLVTPTADDVRAFDTGPANGPIDAAVALLSGGRLRCDEGGESAARGSVAQDEVERLPNPYNPNKLCIKKKM